MAIYDAYGVGIVSPSSIFNGKSLSVLGDSISAYTGTIPQGNTPYYTGNNAGVSSVNDMWWKKLIDSTGMLLDTNNSWSGSRITGTDTSSANARCEDLGNPDVIIIFMGINDFIANVQIGSYDGHGDFPTNPATFREAYAMVLSKVLTKYKRSEVYICTLPYMERIGSAGFPETNTNNVTLPEWNNVIIDIAKLFGVKIIYFAQSDLTYQNMDVYMGDWQSATGKALHPNALGQSVLANQALKDINPGNPSVY